MKKENKNLTISIIAVTLMVVLISGGTYAWWTWNSGTNNTVVNITVAGGTFTLDGGGNITSGKTMAPTDECNHATYAIKRTIRANATNNTTTDMIAKIQLNPSTFPSALKIANLEWVLTTSSTSCTSNIVTDVDGNQAKGNFSAVTQGTIFDLTNFAVSAESTVSKTYYLYIWLNETATNTTQNQTFTLKLTGEMSNDPSA